MSKKKRGRPEGEHSAPQGASQAPGSGEAPSPFGPRSMEKMMRGLTKLLEEQEFESIEEANAFLEQLAGAPIPEMPAEEDPLSRAQDLVYQAYRRPREGRP